MDVERREVAGAPIGWDGRTVQEMLEESERLFEETGYYWGSTGSTSRRRTPSATRRSSPSCAAAWSTRARPP